LKSVSIVDCSTKDWLNQSSEAEATNLAQCSTQTDHMPITLC